jgi:hypothetical protein
MEAQRPAEVEEMVAAAVDGGGDGGGGGRSWRDVVGDADGEAADLDISEPGQKDYEDTLTYLGDGTLKSGNCFGWRWVVASMHYEIFRAAAAAPKGGRCLPRSLRWKAKESAAEAKKKICN